MKCTHVFDKIENILLRVVPLLAAILCTGALLEYTIPDWAVIASFVLSWVLFLVVLRLLLHPISTWLYLATHICVFVSFHTASRLSCLLDGSLNGDWFTLDALRTVPLSQRKRLLYEFAAMKGIAIDKNVPQTVVQNIAPIASSTKQIPRYKPSHKTNWLAIPALIFTVPLVVFMIIPKTEAPRQRNPLVTVFSTENSPINQEDIRYYPAKINTNNELKHPAFVDLNTYNTLNELDKRIAEEMNYGDPSYMRTGEDERRFGLPDVIDCDDYADNLARRARQLGYDVRIVVCVKKADKYSGHAINALVLSDGNAVLMEPQNQEEGKSIFDAGTWFDEFTDYQIGAYNKTMEESSWNL